jgi:hypothetical protein
MGEPPHEHYRFYHVSLRTGNFILNPFAFLRAAGCNNRNRTFTNASARNPLGPTHGSKPVRPSSKKYFGIHTAFLPEITRSRTITMATTSRT